jgi:tripartite-type tricarboxylate transporter receptor subunit TctC
MPANNLRELVAWLKANPDKAAAALPGTFGSGGHISGLDFQRITGTRFQFVPYRGGGPAIQDVVAGHIDLSFGDASTALPHVRGGKVKAYGVTSKKRWDAAPDIPTVDEAGAPGLFFSLWRGLWLPKGAAKETVIRLNSAIADAFLDTAVRQRITELGQEIPPREQQTPEAFGAYHRAEIEKWWPIIKAANIKLE